MVNFIQLFLNVTSEMKKHYTPLWTIILDVGLLSWNASFSKYGYLANGIACVSLINCAGLYSLRRR